MVRVGGSILGFFEGFISDSLDFNHIEAFVVDMTAKRSKIEELIKELLQSLTKKQTNAVCIRREIYDSYKCVTEQWMKTEYDNRVQEWFPVQNGILMVKLTDHEGVDDNGFSKKINS